MSSSSLRRPDPRAALLAALLVMACGLQYVSAAMSSARAAGPQLNIVTVAASTADHLVTLVAECVPAPARPIASEYFTVAAGTTRLPARAVPVISSRPVIGLVVDTSRPGGAGPHDAVSGAANFLLQMPLATRTAVVADTRPATVLSPLHVGAADALRVLSAVPVGNARDTSNALTLVVHQLPTSRDGRRVVVLQTSAPDAGGETADHLIEWLTKAQVVLAVVTTNTDTSYWARITTATGGVVMAARPSAPMAAFDDVAVALRARYVLTFPTPAELPARVSVQVDVAGETGSADVVVPAQQDTVEHGRVQPTSPDGRTRSGVDLLWLMLGAGAVVVTATLVVLLRPRSAKTAGTEWNMRLNALLHGAHENAEDAADAADAAQTEARTEGHTNGRERRPNSSPP